MDRDISSSDEDMEEGEESFFCPRNGQMQLPPAALPSQPELWANSDSIFPLGPRPAVPSQAIAPTLLPQEVTLDFDEDGDFLAATTSNVISSFQNLALDPETPIFKNQASKAAFLATLPDAIQLQLNQPFGKDNLNQCFYLQKSGEQVLFFIFKSGFLSARVKKDLNLAFEPARKLSHIMRRYSMVDFSSLQGFQPNWAQQTGLPLAQRDMTTESR